MAHLYEDSIRDAFVFLCSPEVSYVSHRIGMQLKVVIIGNF